MTDAASPTGLILASGSPRRRSLLQALGLSIQVVHPDIDETQQAEESVIEYVTRMALEKASAGRALTDSPLPLVAGDTVVALGEQVFGKPVDRDDAVRMLVELGGRTHSVHTSVAVDYDCNVACSVVSSAVTFMRISEATAAAYWDSGEPADKAGAYGIQGLGARFVEHLAGSYSAVMGLPVHETANLLSDCGIEIFGQATT
ncbi:MAG: Maf family protein [Pseudomonadota bacterium]